MKVNQAWVVTAAAMAGIRRNNWDDVKVFNDKAPEQARALLQFATNVPVLVAKGAVAQKGEFFLYGGTGQCGNKWSAPSGGWYPIAAVVRYDENDQPQLVAVKMDWY